MWFINYPASRILFWKYKWAKRNNKHTNKSLENTFLYMEHFADNSSSDFCFTLLLEIKVKLHLFSFSTPSPSHKHPFSISNSYKLWPPFLFLLLWMKPKDMSTWKEESHTTPTLNKETSWNEEMLRVGESYHPQK